MPAQTSTPTVICYGVTTGNTWQQEWYETSTGHAGVRARQLRKLGYRVSSQSMGAQVTRVGTVKMTLVDVRMSPGQDLPPAPAKVERV